MTQQGTAPGKAPALKLKKCMAASDKIELLFSDAVNTSGHTRHSALNPANYTVCAPAVPAYAKAQPLPKDATIQHDPADPNRVTITFPTEILKLGNSVIVTVDNVHSDGGADLETSPSTIVTVVPPKLTLTEGKATPDSITISFSDAVLGSSDPNRPDYQYSALNPANYTVCVPTVPAYAKAQPLPQDATILPLGPNQVSILIPPKLPNLADWVVVTADNVRSSKGAPLEPSPSTIGALVGAHVSEPALGEVVIDFLDESGGPFANSKVYLRSTKTGQTREGLTNQEGRFQLSVPKGAYQVFAEAPSADFDVPMQVINV
jgi:hypothetical protein